MPPVVLVAIETTLSNPWCTSKEKRNYSLYLWSIITRQRNESHAFISEYLHVCFMWKTREQMRDVYSNKHEVCSTKLFRYWKNRIRLQISQLGAWCFSFSLEFFLFFFFSFFFLVYSCAVEPPSSKKRSDLLKLHFNLDIWPQRDSFALWKVFDLYDWGIGIE